MDPESGEGNLIMNNDDASLSSDDDSRAREIEENHRIAEALERTGLFTDTPADTRPAPLTGVARIMSYVKTAIFGCILVPLLLLVAAIVIPTYLAICLHIYWKKRMGRLPAVISKDQWIALGYNDDMARILEDLQEQLLNFCTYGTFRMKVFTNSTELRPINLTGWYPSPSVFVPYDAKLQHSWEAFADSLAGRFANVDTDFAIRDFHLPKIILDMLLPSIKKLNLISLGIIQTKSGNDGLIFVSDIIQTSPSLNALNFFGEEIDDDAAAVAFATAVRGNPSLKNICLVDCKFSDSVLSLILEGCKQTKLETLDLKGNPIGGSSGALVCNYIASNATIGTLSLGSNSITDEDVPQLVSALKRNTNLKTLGLKPNNLSKGGKMEMQRAVLNTTDLNSIAESNHFVSIEGIGMNKVNTVNKKKWDVVNKIRSKIVYSLKEGLIDLTYFDGVPIELVHHALALVQFKEGVATNLRGVKIAPVSAKGKEMQKSQILTRIFHLFRDHVAANL